METTLHQQLKAIYAGQVGTTEVRVDRFRIDAVRRGELVEIQLGSLAAIRRKIQRLLEQQHRVRIVKPLIIRKTLCKRFTSPSTDQPEQRRLSPKRGAWIDLVHELVYLVPVYPHPRLTIEVPFLEIEEQRLMQPQRRRRRRRGREKNYQVEDQRLVEVMQVRRLKTRGDLAQLVPQSLPDVFHTGDIAQALGADRWIGQRVAYCWRLAGTIREVGRQGNTRLYRFGRRSWNAA